MLMAIPFSVTDGTLSCVVHDSDCGPLHAQHCGRQVLVSVFGGAVNEAECIAKPGNIFCTLIVSIEVAVRPEQGRSDVFSFWQWCERCVVGLCGGRGG
jgi:hypothetical protein